ncbi:MAG TPA: hypothetical protein VIU93_04760 [Gallionellaceae bacterium]
MNQNLRNAVMGIFLALMLGGCVMPRTSIDSLSAVDKSKEVVIVGRIEIDPKIQKEDVSLKNTIGAGDLYRQFVLRVNEDVGETTNYMADRENMTVVQTEEDFYITQKRPEPFKLYGGWFYTAFNGGNGGSISTVLFHIVKGMKIEIPKGADAIYLGTIRFTRDEFYNLKAINLIQTDYEAAQKRFQKKFNTKMVLTKVRVTQAAN